MKVFFIYYPPYRPTAQTEKLQAYAHEVDLQLTSNGNMENWQTQLCVPIILDNVRLKHLQEELRSEEHTSELQSRGHLVCRLLLEKKKSKSSKQTKCKETLKIM